MVYFCPLNIIQVLTREFMAKNPRSDRSDLFVRNCFNVNLLFLMKLTLILINYTKTLVKGFFRSMIKRGQNVPSNLKKMREHLLPFVL